MLISEKNIVCHSPNQNLICNSRKRNDLGMRGAQGVRHVNSGWVVGQVVGRQLEVELD